MLANKRAKPKSVKKAKRSEPIPKPTFDYPGDFRGTGVGPAVEIDLAPEIQEEIAWEKKLGPEKYQKLCDEREQKQEKERKEREAREAPIEHLLDHMFTLGWFRPDLATEVIRQTVPHLPQECLDLVRRAVQQRQKGLDKERRGGKKGKPTATETPRILFQWLQVAWWRLAQGKTWQEIAKQRGKSYKDTRGKEQTADAAVFVLKRQVQDLAGMVRSELRNCGAVSEGKALDNALAWNNTRAMLYFRFGFPLLSGDRSRKGNRLLAQALFFPGSDLPSDEQITSNSIDIAKKLYIAGDGHEPTLKLLRKLLRKRPSPVTKR